ncbi:MAG TPA: tetratricopeptide repeat-containing sensor histidine kinase [Tenuifilaceae bacterium]|nr:tetratricopeptide repeat-containing sensor histidine kinase [Bacteroidota bacterium]MZP81229.1 tetratricopeptide repeat protein [Bacteroidales bacterium]HNV80761.1 tetratricopeptide repeat-containing sensor histidine kinase [Tenuifilaceae bacterium]HOM84061.1 tetratricopeptide repeat-containing sensor histidine kinase [Tenuifilaceae bacterium]HOU62046.1 tetratricopeptide repeat-containing sensor histidine kinase [Tenuifilaceae bacterium]
MVGKRIFAKYVVLFFACISGIYIEFSHANITSPQIDNSLIDSLNNLAYTHRRRNPKLSLEYAIKAYELCSKTNYIQGRASTIHNKGTALAVLGRYELALIDLFEASKIREQIGDISGLVSTYNNIGHVQSEMGKYDEALHYFEESIKLCKELSPIPDIGITLNNIGWVYFNKNKLDLALTYFYQALSANEAINDIRGIGASKGNIGTIYRHMGDFKKGLEYHYHALNNAQQFDDKYWEIITLREISKDYHSANQLEKSIEFANRSLEVASALGFHVEERNTLAWLASIHETNHHFKNAARFYKLVHQLSDSLFRVEKAEIQNQFFTVYEFQAQVKENQLLQMEQEINSKIIRNQKYFLFLSFALIIISLVFTVYIITTNKKMEIANLQLKDKNCEIEQQKEVIQQKVQAIEEKNRELEKINQIKDKLIAVIAHDLKNPFNNISGYSELLVSRYHSFEKKEIQEFLKIINESSAKGNYLLDNLLQWYRLQTMSLQFLPLQLNLYNIVKDELLFYTSIAQDRGINIINSISQGITIHADSNMLKTIIRNLVTNALKYTDKNGIISISASYNNREVTVAVEDSGRGIDPLIKEKLFTGEHGVTSTGQGGEKGSGLGLILCKDFVEMHHGRIWVESEPGKGAKFFFTLPVPEDTEQE